MKKSAIVLSLYIGTFAVATAGFYIGKIEAAKETTNASSLSDNPGAAPYQRLPASDGEHRNTDDQSVSTDPNSEPSANQSKNKGSIIKPSASADGNSNPARSRPGSDNTGLVNDSDTDEYIDTDTANNSVVSPYSYNDISLSTSSSGTSIVASLSSTGTELTTINSATEITQTDTTSSADISSTETSTTEISSQHTDGLSSTSVETTDEQVLDEQVPDEPVEEQWATPNCPSQLAEGSTEADAKLMQQAYGCRYLKTCRSLNDGQGGHICWWGFYSSL